jgi:CheY-like chemotaxis protein
MSKRFKKILIVDDDPNQIKLIKIYLKHFDLEITTATNGRHAMHIIKSREFDIILTDYQMPEMDGETLISNVRNELNLMIPIVMISANDKQPKLSKYKNIKILRKPFTPDQIKSIFK